MGHRRFVANLAMCPRVELIDGVKVSCPTRHRIGHFRDVLPSQCLGLVLKKLKLTQQKQNNTRTKLECGPMLNVMVTLPNIDGALCSTPQSLADAHY